ncbi:hypothetical protein EXIGLDRAFT_730684 [Exidia glandulosa HHB12029]|uniref:F-box domain-containing protein n=1 Tax=Exidia glandulosa HHB12029 TaxID=1314781 RepID=A0A165L7L6_EXIGL|nr:hypothetical protein EXIGLDRAFT_730684 [Exidia glandulosa HHB12029]
MGGFDSYCFICGGQAQVASVINGQFKTDAKDVPVNRRRPFLLDKEDSAFQEDLVTIGPYDENNEEIIRPDEIYRGAMPALPSEVERLESIDPDTIRMIDKCIPGGCHDLGGLDGHDGHGYTINAAVYPFGHALCFRLLEAFTPRLMQPVGKFWATVRALNGVKYTRIIKGVDYGDIAGAQEQYVNPFHGYGSYALDEALPPSLRDALRQNEVDPSILRDYWLGTGRMYTWVRPDKFPVHQAFSDGLKLLDCPDRSSAGSLAPFQALPLDVLLAVTQHQSLRDVLSLLALCTSVRACLTPLIDTIARQHLPASAFPSAFEQEWWNELVRKAGGQSRDFPWFSYARQCYQSPSMRNRERIWGICKQLEELAIQHHVLQ